MNTRTVGMLAVLVATGCAHGQSNRGAHAERHTAAPAHERTQARRTEAEDRRAEGDAYRREHGADVYGTDPNNTRVNERDRDSASLTPLDQSSDEHDVDLTAQIRKAIIGDDSLSFTAKNTKIITRDGLVTLRGTVVNAREKETLARTAGEIAGRGKVVDELEVER